MTDIDWSKAPKAAIANGYVGLGEYEVWVGADWYEHVSNGERHKFDLDGTYKMSELTCITLRPSAGITSDLIEVRNSTHFLQAAIDVQAERGKQYDTPNGERSMGRTVQAFNAITGRDLTEAEGWLLLQVLKDVRQWQNPGKFHEDSALDCVAYSSLKAEALANGGSQ